MIFFKKIFSTIILLTLVLFLKSQENNFIKFIINDTIIKTEKSNLKTNSKLIKNQIISLIELGFLSSTKDSVKNSRDTIDVYISTGEKYNFTKIKILADETSKKKINNRFNSTQLLFDPNSFSHNIQNWLNEMNNNGYPFAKFSFNKSKLTNNTLSIICNLENGPFIKIDSIENPNISEKEINLISKIIEIKKGDPYDFSKIKATTEKLSRITYFSVMKPTAYEFNDNHAKIYTYVKSKAMNNINGLIGIQPNDNGKTQLTGNISMTLLNTLKSGEMFHVNWRKMFNASQNLITSFSIPYLFKSNIEIKGHLNMIKKDTSFFNLKTKANISYLISSNYSIGIIYDLVGSTNLLKSEYNSTSVNNFGFNLHKNKLNQSINPSKGYLINCELLAGIKKTYITENNEEKLFNSPNYQGSLNYNQFIRLNNRIISKIGLNGLTTINDNLFENELTRIGGYQSLRGFDEESIFVSSYLIGNFEFRFLLDKKSNIFVFSDIAWTEKKINYSQIERLFNSVGIGTNFSVNNGMLTIIYAIGRETNFPFVVKTGKIHLGFNSYF